MVSHTALPAFTGLVAMQISVSLIYKFAAIEGDIFSQSGFLTLGELTKLLLSILFLRFSIVSSV